MNVSLGVELVFNEELNALPDALESTCFMNLKEMYVLIIMSFELFCLLCVFRLLDMM